MSWFKNMAGILVCAPVYFVAAVLPVPRILVQSYMDL